ncbi:FKBP-type peptidyl-prolyl cis-trans isomerase [Novosphingobium sp. 9]|uniref:FKBP-type peptidyl-prolyl cis-trans isomerase n=1 Tax=Novosphingobium sp. 9 TaxID=2025349 RepID=UPI0021B67EFE|nr:FKBP-type peptidyl-prolyl cis-trans isomerase [Novosphingobium sp. 9]
MTEITRVPLQPVAKGSLGKIWGGVVVLAIAAAGIAYATVPASVKVVTLSKGQGDSPTVDDVVLINYKGMLPDGQVFDQANQVPMELNGVIPGFAKALVQMQRGGKYEVKIPSSLAYGDKAVGKIPANTDLTFDIDLIDYKTRAEIQQIQQMQQMQMQMQGGAAGGAAGAPAGAPDAAGAAPATQP